MAADPVEINPSSPDFTRRLIWSGLLAGTGALASIAAHRAAEFIWIRIFKEEPPE